MATRFYFSSEPQTVISGAINPDWTGAYAGFDRYFLETTANSAFVTQANTQSMSSGQSYCIGQWWSHPINNAGSFSTTDWNNSLWSTLMRFSESALAANYVYKYQMRIYEEGSGFIWNSFFTGGTEFDAGNGSTTNSVMESRRCSGCDYWGTISANNGARIVMEVGVYRTSGTAASHTSYAEIGGNSGTDLSNDQTGVSQFNPWFESTLNFTMDAEASEETTPSRMMLLGVG